MSIAQTTASREKQTPIKDLFIRALENPDLNSDKVIARLASLKEQWVRERDKINQRIWRNNVLFYAGNHYVRESFNSGNQYRVRLRENHINNIMNRLLSIVVQNMPITRVFPASDQASDIENAKNSEAYLKYFWRVKKLERELSKFVKYSLIFGNAFIYQSWNPDLGGKMILDPEESQSGDKEISLYRGDIDICIDDPFKIAVRPGIDKWDDIYDAMRIIPVSRSMLEAKYGEIEAESAIGFNSYTNEYRTDDDTVMLNAYWHKPTSWFEEGMYVAWCGKKLLKIRPSLKAENVLPINHLGFDDIPGRLYATASIEQVIDLQEQLNRASSMIVEARNLVARPRAMVSNEAKVPSQSISDRPGEIFRYSLAGGPPQFIVPSFNFAELAANKADLRNAMSMVTGITTASRGEVPNATRTALALQLVLEQDRSQYLPFIKKFHQSVLDMANGILNLAAENIDESDPRAIKIEGKIIESKMFHGGMVPSPLDIWLEDTNPLGWTSGSRIETIGNLAQMGVLTDKNQILEMLKINSADPAFEIISINKQTQQKENQLLERGQHVPTGSADNHEVHLEELTKVMASFEFKSKPDVVKMMYQAHREEHLMALGPEPQPSVNPEAGALKNAPEMMAAPLPGQNIEELISSSRAG